MNNSVLYHGTTLVVDSPRTSPSGMHIQSRHNRQIPAFPKCPEDMKDYIFNRKVTRIIVQLAETLGITPARALVIFYGTETGKMLHDPSLGLQLMSDTYIVNDIIAELRGKQ